MLDKLDYEIYNNHEIKNGGDNMTTTEIKILYTFSNIIPRLPTIDKERLLAFGQGLAFKLDLEREQQIEAESKNK